MEIMNRLFGNLASGRTSIGAVVTMSDLVVTSDWGAMAAGIRAFRGERDAVLGAARGVSE